MSYFSLATEEKTILENIPEFRVFRHKTAYLYGAQRVTISADMVQDLLDYGNNMVGPNDTPHSYKRNFWDKSGPLFVFPRGGFSTAWAKIRAQKQIRVTNRNYRHYIETKVSMYVDKHST